MNFVVGVVVRREVLHAVERGVGHTIEMFNRRDAQFGEVPGRRLFDSDVGGGLQVLPVGFVEHRFEQVSIDAEDLEPVRPGRLGPPHAFANAVGGLGTGPAPAPRRRVDQDARCDQCVRSAVGAPPPGLLDVGADVPYGGDARSEVQVGFVLERLRNAAPLILQVHVRIHEARQHVLACRVDDGIGRGIGSARASDPRDEAVLHEDVDRAERRFGVAVDHHGVSDQQAGDGPGMAWRRHLLENWLLGSWGGRQRADSDAGGNCQPRRPGSVHVCHVLTS